MRSFPTWSRVLRLARVLAAGGVLASLSACVTVKPQQRAVLADPIMQFEGDPQQAQQLRHAIDNREGSYGGGGVSGGGCGCN
ncbi:MAG: hypothetical protein JWP97_2283 [Labilithrix sp.]|nr:hypothetical protein [Labilithrix sp.]